MTPGADDQFDDFLGRCRDAVRHQVAGDSGPFHALWAQSDDIVLMGAAGAHQLGWADVDRHLTDAASHLRYDEFEVRNLMTVRCGDLAVTVDLEHMRRRDADSLRERILRVTQVYCRRDGEWRVIVRHGDPLDSPVPLA